MKYQISGFTLDTIARTLSKGNDSKPVRPKTLALLIYLIEKPGQIISKQEILDQVWEDVIVDEGVVFQSIREIRQLFQDNGIVKNHPRKGYQLCATLDLIPTIEVPVTDQTNNAINKSFLTGFKPFHFIALATLVVLVFVILQSLNSGNHQPQNSPDNTFSDHVLVLPIKNHIPYSDHQWVYLGGMEQLISKLNQMPDSVYVQSSEQVLELLRQANIPRDFQTESISRIQALSGASLIVETEVYGNVYDYKLVYRLYLNNQIKEGVVLAASLSEGLQQLTLLVAEYINSKLLESANQSSDEFSDALFARAMTAYEHDWQSAISFFESYLTLTPESVIALRYLSKLYLWQNELEKVTQLVTRTIAITEDNPKQLAHGYYLLGLVENKKARWREALKYLNKSSNTLAQSKDPLLSARIAEAEGNAYDGIGELTAAASSYQRALDFYQIINSPIGIYSVQLSLANNLRIQGKSTQAQQLFNETRDAINTKQIDFLFSMVRKFQPDFE